MARKIAILTSASESHSSSIKRHIHGVNELHNDFTFCTIAYVVEEFESTNEKITCPDCIKVVKYFKSIRASKYET